MSLRNTPQKLLNIIYKKNKEYFNAQVESYSQGPDNPSIRTIFEYCNPRKGGITIVPSR